jgi:hypothetical protein
MHALLAHNDRVPALLGLAGALEETSFMLTLARDIAYIEAI